LHEVAVLAGDLGVVNEVPVGTDVDVDAGGTDVEG
jgi:hypothetical protein